MLTTALAVPFLFAGLFLHGIVACGRDIVDAGMSAAGLTLAITAVVVMA